MNYLLRKACCLGLAFLLCMGFATAGAEDQEILLPDGAHYLTIPAEMEYQEPAEDETDLRGIYLMPPDLEMLVFSYQVGDVTAQGLAEALVSTGREAEVREIGGVDFLVFQDRDDADEAPCIGYSYLNQGTMVEISFFYATQAAMDLTVYIMESFR